MERKRLRRVDSLNELELNDVAVLETKKGSSSARATHEAEDS